jgi:O-antigen biosynthesis protein
MTLPRISIVVPSYQQAQYLPATLDSIFSQGYPALEVIVMDGGSTDGSAEIIRRCADRLAYWTSAPDGGQSAALNAGFARATGEVMTWLNSDDVLLPGALHAAGEIFAAFPQVAWLTGQPANMDAGGRLRVSRLRTGRLRGLIQRGAYHGRGWGFIRQEGTFWRRSLWDAAGGRIDTARRYAMDYELWQRMAAHASLYTADRALAAFREHAEQKTAQIDRYYAEAGITAPDAARLVMLPLRAALGPLLWRLSPRVVRIGGAWVVRG